MNKHYDNKKTNIRWILQAVKPHQGQIQLLILIQIAVTVLSLLNAVFLRTLIDSGAAGNRDLFRSMAIRMLLIAAAENLFLAVNEYLSGRLTYRIQKDLQQRLFNTMLNKDFSWFSKKHTGEWMNRMVSDTEALASMLSALPGTVGILINLIATTCLLLNVSLLFLPIIAVGFVFFVVLTLLTRKEMIRRQRKVREAQGQTRSLFTDSISQMVIVKAFSREEQAAGKADNLLKNEFQTKMRRMMVTLYKTTIQNIGFKFTLLAVIITGAYFLLDKRISYGSVTMCFRLLTQIRVPISKLGNNINNFFDFFVSAERLREAEDYPDDPACPVKSDEEISVFYKKQFQEIEFRNVTFSYRDHDTGALYTTPKVFSHVDLSISKQSFTAFTGLTGSGKSTIFKLLMSLYPLDSGRKLIRNQDGSENELDASYRRLFAYVPQGNQLMTGSIREIVAFSDETVPKDDEGILKALEIACALDFVEKLPKGLDTQIREKGLGLSEGQVQRLAIARAIYTGRPILLLDEATSSLDEKTERDLLEHLKDLTDKTVLIVTHRPAALSICDNEVHIDAESVICRKLKKGSDK